MHMLSLLWTVHETNALRFQALKQFQIETRRLESACRRFSATYGRVLVSSPKGGKEAMVKVKTKEYKEIALLGRKYAIMVEPWVDKHTFAPRPEGIDVSDPSNYESTWRVEQRRIEELHLFIPKTFHEGVAGSEDLRVKVRLCRTSINGIPSRIPGSLSRVSILSGGTPLAYSANVPPSFLEYPRNSLQRDNTLISNDFLGHEPLMETSRSRLQSCSAISKWPIKICS